MIVKTNLHKPDASLIKKASDILRNNGVIVYPTDTAYGIGVNAKSIDAIRKLYKLKSRDYSKPTHVVVKDWKMIEKIAFTNILAKKAYLNLMPGPLTIILQKKKYLPDILAKNLNTIGIRIPDSQFTKFLSNQFPFPYTTPSANRSGEKTPYSINDVKNALNINDVDLIIDVGKLPQKPTSTIVDLSDNLPKMVRKGAIDENIILKALDGNKLT